MRDVARARSFRRRPHLAALALAGMAASALALAAVAQSDDPPSDDRTDVVEALAPPPELITLEDFEPRLTQLEAIESPNESEQLELTLLRQAKSYFSQAVLATEQAAVLTKAAAAASDLLQAIEADLASPPPDPADGIPTDATQEQLNTLIANARTDRDDARQDLSRLELDSSTRQTRRAAMPEERRDARTGIERLDLALSTPPDPEDSAEIAIARRQSDLAERQTYAARLHLLDAEIQDDNALSPIRRPREQLAQRRVQEAEERVTALSDALTAFRENEATRLREQAESESRQAAAEHELVRAIREQNQTLASELADVLGRMNEFEDLRVQVEATVARWAGHLTRIEEKINRIGYTEAIGIELRQRSTDLPEIQHEVSRLRQLRREMNRVQLRQREIVEELARLTDKAAVVEEMLREAVPPIAPARVESVRTAALAAVEAEKEYLLSLDNAYDSFFNETLIELHETGQSLGAYAEQFREFIEEHIFWIQSTSPLRLSDAEQLRDGLAWLTNASNWGLTARAIGAGVRQHPVRTILVLTGVVALVLFRRRIRRTILDLNERAAAKPDGGFGATIAAVSLVMLLAIPGPLFVWLISFVVASAEDSVTFAGKVSSGLAAVSHDLLFVTLVWAVCGRSEVAQAHFGWPRSSTNVIRRTLRWFTPLFLPLVFVQQITEYQPFDPNQDTLGRLAFIGRMLVVSVALWRVMSPTHGILADYIDDRKGGWLDRLRYAWFPAIVGLPYVLIATASLGYFYTAVQLQGRTVQSLILIVSVVVAYALAMRWIVLSKQRLAIETARQRQKEAEEKPQAKHMPVVSRVQEIDVAALTEQSRRLFHTMSGIVVLFGLWAIWRDVMPALGILRELELGWTDTITTDVEDAAGDLVRHEVPVTLLDLLRAVVLLVLTAVVVKNIPAALEMTILPRLPLTRGGRYAISTLIRYVLVIVGVVWAFDMIGLGWSKVQWLAAAISVGLGFGLQEIVANFVSGIIILFEQPIRVGDTVTVGEQHGSVARIRMRATTIIDWDRKELIIPNKDFVTGQIINWSLSNDMMRVVMPLHVSPGTDTQLVRRLLLEAARSVEHVLEDPSPLAVCTRIDDSGLRFELRVYIPLIRHLVGVRDEILAKVHVAFMEAGVDFAVPRRELRIESSSKPPDM